MTIQQMAQAALDVQDACNLSGVVRTFAEVTSAMRLVHHFDTPTCNRHPVSQLFADKIADLTGARGMDDYSAAYDACKALAAPPSDDGGFGRLSILVKTTGAYTLAGQTVPDTKEDQ